MDLKQPAFHPQIIAHQIGLTVDQKNNASTTLRIASLQNTSPMVLPVAHWHGASPT